MYINSFEYLWQNMQTYVIFELFIYFLSSLLFIHSIRKNFFLLWCYILINGILNDHFFMLLSLSNNFWHSQALIMLTDRMPLYIVFIYHILVYPGFILIQNSKLDILSISIISSFIGSFLYAFYDYIGVNFIWWTWHTTDLTIKYRWLGVPFSSTCWSIIHIFSFLTIYQTFYYRIFSTIFTIPLMMIIMGLFNLPTSGISDKNTLILIILFFSLFLFKKHCYKIISKSIYLGLKKNVLIFIFITIYFIILFNIYLFGNPRNHYSYGLHQQYGPDNIISKDLFGYKRCTYFSKKHTNRLFVLPVEPEYYSDTYMINGKSFN